MTTGPLARRCTKPTLGSRRAPKAAYVPDWLDDDTIVHAVVGAKRMCPPSVTFWARLAVLAQFGAAIVRGRVRGSRWPELTQDLTAALAAELPPPGIAFHDPRANLKGPAGLAARHHNLAIDDLADCLTAIAVELACPDPPDLEYLADLVDDLSIALYVYRVTDVAMRTRRPQHVPWAPPIGRDPPRRAAI